MFCLSLLGKFLAMMHVIDAVLDSFSDLFRSHRYSPLGKLSWMIVIDETHTFQPSMLIEDVTGNPQYFID